MARRDDNLQARLDRDLAELKLSEIAKSYREVLDEAARKGSSALEVLAILFGLEQAFDALGPEAREFHLGLKRRPVKTGVHLRRLLGLPRIYGSTEVLSAIAKALEFAAYDAAYVENLLLAQRRRRQLPTPTLPTPRRRELIDDIELEPADPAIYDRFCNTTDEDPHGTAR